MNKKGAGMSDRAVSGEEFAYLTYEQWEALCEHGRCVVMPSGGCAVTQNRLNECMDKDGHVVFVAKGPQRHLEGVDVRVVARQGPRNGRITLYILQTV